MPHEAALTKDDVPAVGRTSLGAKELLALAVIIVGLYFFREVFIPLASAILLGFILAPIVRLVQKLGVGRLPAVLATVIVASAILSALAFVMTTQIGSLAENLPRYEYTIREKVKALRAATLESGAIKRFSESLRDLGNGIERDRKEPTTESPAPKNAEAKPVSVEVHQPEPTTLEALQRVVAPMIGPTLSFGITLIFVVFVLLQQEDLRNRFIRLAGAADLQRTTLGIDDAAFRLSRFLLSQFIINSAFAVAIALGLWLIGIPSAILWGLIAGAFRFVPYVGTLAAAVVPLTLAAAVDSSWLSVLLTFTLFFVVEPLVAYAIEPVIYGNRVGLSPVAIIVSAAFWTSLWGPIGLLLSTPLTMCLVVVGRHAEAIRFLDVMLSDRPALTPAQVFYQRILAGDPEEAVQQAEQALETQPLVNYFDDVVLQGLQAAQIDIWRGITGPEQLATMEESLTTFFQELSFSQDQPASVPNETGPSRSVVCIPGKASLDTIAAEMLRDAFLRQGIKAHVESASVLEAASQGNLQNQTLVYLCYLDVTRLARLRYAVRRARRKAPKAMIVVCCWMLTDNSADELKTSVQADKCVSNLAQAIEQANSHRQILAG